MWVQSLGWEDSLEKGMATHSSTLAWEIPGQRSLVGYIQSIGSQSQTILSDQHTHLAQSVTVASTICVKSVVSLKLGSHWLC